MFKVKSCTIAIFFMTCLGFSQEADNPIKVFGFFQNSFSHITHDNKINYNSFNMQQLNILLQKDLLEDWTAFINFQAVNNFSAERRWGSYSIEEAWIRYRFDNHMNLLHGNHLIVSITKEI